MLIILGTCFPRLNRIGLCTICRLFVNLADFRELVDGMQNTSPREIPQKCMCHIENTMWPMFYESNLTKLKQYKNYDATLEWISLHCDVHCVPNIKKVHSLCSNGSQLMQVLYAGMLQAGGAGGVRDFWPHVQLAPPPIDFQSDM